MNRSRWSSVSRPWRFVHPTRCRWDRQGHCDCNRWRMTVCELKNLAVDECYQCCGIGSRMVEWLCVHYHTDYHTMLEGTGNWVQTVSLYRKIGFVMMRLPTSLSRTTTTWLSSRGGPTMRYALFWTSVVVGVIFWNNSKKSPCIWRNLLPSNSHTDMNKILIDGATSKSAWSWVCCTHSLMSSSALSTAA